MRNTAKQALQFAGVGAFNTVLNYGIYAAAITLGAHYLVASILGYVISVFSAWLFQYFIVFREGGADSDQPWWKTVIKTYLSYGFTGLILNNILLILLLDVAHYEVILEPLFAMGTFFIFDTPRGMAEYLAPFIVMVVAVPINFILNKFWAYGKPKADKAGDESHDTDEQQK